MTESNPSLPAKFARWALFIPLAIAVAIGVRVVVFYLNRYALSQVIPFFMSESLGPDSLIGGGFVVLFSDGAMGAAFVYLATSVAPTHKRQVAIVLGTIALLLGLTRSLYLLLDGDGWGAFTYLCVAVGASLCAAFRSQEYRKADLRERDEA